MAGGAIVALPRVESKVEKSAANADLRELFRKIGRLFWNRFRIIKSTRNKKNLYKSVVNKIRINPLKRAFGYSSLKKPLLEFYAPFV